MAAAVPDFCYRKKFGADCLNEFMNKLFRRQQMRNEDYNELFWFTVVAEERSFTRAAAMLGVSQSAVSHAIRRLEERVGLRLLTRTTRNVAPTDVGEKFLQAIRPRLDELSADVADLMRFRDIPSGTVRINLGDYALESVVWPKLRNVLKEYPDINVEFFCDNGISNIIEERFDAGVRLGERLDKDMIAVRIGGDWRLVVVGSPDYFERYPRPTQPEHLMDQCCINSRQSSSGGLYAWEFEKDGRQTRVRVNGTLTFNHSPSMIDAALNGYGLAYVPESLVAEHIAQGRLILVLGDWCPLFEGYFIYYPNRRQMSPALSVIVDALRYKPG
ncbi:UNVERIFIED_ORG: DNA-binding transcriptional LysR family regulator [Rhizobium sophorae]|nr:lysR substrate binding domain protein [Rhizobium leguminosarum bv. viciae]MBB4524841.1 DNA-binding transcriptional LysR family regulator [Rhizobium leguminosarum]MBP2490823.1 DNA-binding transcriptional LysR family regulator [Rhizobium leguminosarum]MDH6661978.1 DNA-binding transcriptional LysR family regulator [Rhizobium sophorae]